MTRRFAGSIVALALSLPQAARADLGNDVERVVLAYSAFGHVTHPAPRLLERGDDLPLVLPPEALDPKKPGCATLVLLATTGTHFLLDSRRVASASAEEEPPEGSLAGALALTRCNEKKPELSLLGIQMRSPRGVLETVLVSSPGPLPALTEVLPHRAPGPLAPAGGLGPRPSAMPVALRLRALEERSSREGALELARQELDASPFGMGTALITLASGCHRFDLVGDDASQRSADVDLEVTRADTGELLAADHGESSDASALLCVGAPIAVSLRFAGAPPFSHLELLRARWDLEATLPRRFGSEVRARMSAVLREQGSTLAGARLVDESLGVQGDTRVSLEVEPFACYEAIIVGLRGESSLLSVAARTSRGDAESRIGGDVPGAALGFCAGPEERAALEIDARGLGLVWMTAIFQRGRLRPGVEAE